VKIFDPSTGAWIDDGINPNTPVPNIGSDSASPKNLISNKNVTANKFDNALPFYTWKNISFGSSSQILSPGNGNFNIQTIVPPELNNYGINILRATTYEKLNCLGEGTIFLSNYNLSVGSPSIINGFCISRKNPSYLLNSISAVSFNDFVNGMEVICSTDYEQITDQNGYTTIIGSSKLTEKLYIPSGYGLFAYDGSLWSLLRLHDVLLNFMCMYEIIQ